MSVEHAYAAGLFDGEGCVVVTQRHTQQWTTELQLSNCDIRALEFMEDLYGGRYRAMVDRKTDRRWGIWVVTGKFAQEAAEKMLPYSLLKKEQLELFIEIRKTVGGRGIHIDSDTHVKRQRLSKKLNSLKRPVFAL